MTTGFWNPPQPMPPRPGMGYGEVGMTGGNMLWGGPAMGGNRFGSAYGMPPLPFWWGSPGQPNQLNQGPYQAGMMAGRVLPGGGVEAGGFVNGQWVPNQQGPQGPPPGQGAQAPVANPGQQANQRFGGAAQVGPAGGGGGNQVYTGPATGGPQPWNPGQFAGMGWAQLPEEERRRRMQMGNPFAQR